MYYGTQKDVQLVLLVQSVWTVVTQDIGGMYGPPVRTVPYRTVQPQTHITSGRPENEECDNLQSTVLPGDMIITILQEQYQVLTQSIKLTCGGRLSVVANATVPFLYCDIT